MSSKVVCPPCGKKISPDDVPVPPLLVERRLKTLLSSSDAEEKVAAPVAASTDAKFVRTFARVTKRIYAAPAAHRELETACDTGAAPEEKFMHTARICHLEASALGASVCSARKRQY